MTGMTMSEYCGTRPRRGSTATAAAQSSSNDEQVEHDGHSSVRFPGEGHKPAGRGGLSVPRLDLSVISGGGSTDVGGEKAATSTLSPMLYSNTIRKSVKPSQISSRLTTNLHVKSPVKSWTTPQSGTRSASWAATGSEDMGPRGTTQRGMFTPYQRTQQMEALNLTGRVHRDGGLMASHTRALLRHDHSFAELTVEPVFRMPKFDPNYQEVTPPKTPRDMSPPRHPWQTERTRNVQRAMQRQRLAIMRSYRGSHDGSGSSSEGEGEEEEGVYTMRQRQAVFTASQLTPVAKEVYLKALNVPSRVRSAARQVSPSVRNADQLQAVTDHNEEGTSGYYKSGQGQAGVAAVEEICGAGEGTSPSPGSAAWSSRMRDVSGSRRSVRLLDTSSSSTETPRGSTLVRTPSVGDAYSMTQAARKGEQLRQSVLNVWAEDGRQARHARIPIPTPDELSDTEIQESEVNENGVWVVNHELVKARLTAERLAGKTAEADNHDGDSKRNDEMGEKGTTSSRGFSSSHGRDAPDTPRQSAEDRNACMQQARENLDSHEDYMFTGSLGALSARRHYQRKEFDAATKMNRVAYNPKLARQESRKFWDTDADAREWYDKSMRQPGNSRRQQKFLRSLEDLQSQRPHFHAPSPRDVKTRHKRIPWRRQPPPPPPKPRTPPPPPPPEWNIDDSIFAARKRECDARAYYDTPSLLKKQIKLDWQRATAKKRFVKFMRTMDCRVVPDGFHPNELLHKTEAVLGKYLLRVRAAFYYYCARGTTMGEASFSMTSNSWATFCREMGIEDPGSRKCSSAALGSMFVATNYEETGALSSSNDKENDDNALMRLEWLEILVRAAIAKYIEDKKATADVVEALELLCVNHLSRLPPQLAADPNTFRAERMYNEEVDTLLLGHKAFLEAVFRCYKSKSASKYFWMEHWMTLLDNLRLINDRTGLGITQAKIIFMWSMMGSMDELTKRQKAVSWTFVDFIEGLARLADSLPLPPPLELEAAAADYATQRPPGFTATGLFRHWEYLTLMDERYIKMRRRPSAQLDLVAVVPGERTEVSGEGEDGVAGATAVSSRPLSEKMDAFVHLMIAGLSEVWGLPGVNERELVVKLKRAAAYTGGGVEMA